MKAWFYKYYPLLLILLVSTALRINLLSVRGTLWFDEIFSVHFSSLPWTQAIKYWLIETNPFLHTLFLRGYIYLFGDGDTVVRIPSVIFGLVAIIAVYFFAQKIISRKGAIISASLVSLSGIFLFVNTEARVYSLFTLLTITSFQIFYTLFVEKKQSKWIWYLYFFNQLLLLYCHLTAVTVLVIQALSLIYLKELDRDAKKKFIITNIIATFFWLFWFIPSLLPKLNSNTLYGWYFTYDKQSANLLTTFTTLFINAELTDFVLTTFAIIFIASIFVNLKKYLDPTTKQPEKTNLIILLLWGFVPIILGSIMGQYVTKYFLFSMPALAMLFAYSIENIKEKILQQSFTIILFALIIPSTLVISNNPIFSWEAMTKYVEKHETNKSVVLFIPFNEELSFRRYYQGKAEILGVYPNKDNLSLDERIVRYNWMMIFAGDYDKWMEEKISGKDRVFLFQYNGFYSQTTAWFIERGWKLYAEKKPNGQIAIQMFEFHAPTSTIDFK